ncbi:hypothetical protein PACTADRAFT_72545 [Pachysolen tannophilus NRRL Y-2460]|uniref:Enoyl reductase (ER) domain-containing protein n=1 Tax=Pachysolen tannophilus NRRL Y-2460 TaxID=669874 RepID=A0A1E4TNH6_PACTA|nr:hypothetical protein PACTADRAFT_72545 [Pachysolen tannophilus NRRL Y-2460]
MRGLLYYGAKDIRFSNNIPVQKPKMKDDVLLKVAYCGICGTDLHEYQHPNFFTNAASETGDKISGKKLPLVLGHEFSGIVQEVGSNVQKIKPGDHVVVEPTGHCHDRKNHYNGINKNSNDPYCSSCYLGYPNCCKDLSFCGLGVENGALSEYVNYSADHVLKIPKDKIPLDVAALIEPLAIAWHAIELASTVKEGCDTLVIGGGPIGLLTILALQGHRVGKIVCSEPASIRREQAAKLGVEVFNPDDFNGDDKIQKLKNLAPPNQGGFSASFDCCGNPATFKTSIHALKTHGVAVNVAIWHDVPVLHKVMDLSYQEKYAVGSIGSTISDFEKVIEKIESGDISIDRMRQLITSIVPLEHAIEKGFKELATSKDAHIKILISPNLKP